MDRSKRILIVGISGTGKSTLGRKLAGRLDLPLHHMDSLIWKPNWQEASEAEIGEALTAIAKTDSWIVEGWIDTYSKPLLERATQILYLDFPGWQAALGGLKRAWVYRGSKRPEMPEGCTEDFDLKFLKVMLLRQERPHIERILATANPAIVKRLTSRRAANEFLRRQSKYTGQNSWFLDKYTKLGMNARDIYVMKQENPDWRSFFWEHNLPFRCWNCAHLRHRRMAECDAFPEGIPLEIWMNYHWHDRPFPGDNGIQFEQRTIPISEFLDTVLDESQPSPEIEQNK
ncbi:MAG: hypothetical protein QM758_17525 [Armatimonas sp.]